MHNYLKPLFILLLIFLSFSSVAQTSADSVKKRDTCKCLPANRYSQYEPNYIISNFGQNYFGQVKFKISFKFDLSFSNEKNKVYFAYTQYAYWDIYKQSSPMRELDFAPTFFYEHVFNAKIPMGGWNFTFFDLKGGYLHQSDGQPDGPYDRSVFKVTSSADMAFTTKQRGQQAFGLDEISESIRGWIWNMVASDNSNIAKYQGYGQFITTLKFDFGSRSKTTNYNSYPIEINDVLVPAKAGLSNECNLLINPFIGDKRAGLIPYIFIQYFHGYGENLINYDNRYTGGKALNEFRAGVQFRAF